MDDIRKQIVATATSYVGTPWRRYGRSKFGVDCVGLLICVASDLKLGDYENKNYSREYRYSDLTRDLIKAGCKFIPRHELANGDIVAMTSSTIGAHAGIYCKGIDEEDKLIHAYILEKKVCIDSYTYYKDLVTSQYVFPGVA